MYLFIFKFLKPLINILKLYISQKNRYKRRKYVSKTIYVIKTVLLKYSLKKKLLFGT